jgi:hypothetical protein
MPGRFLLGPVSAEFAPTNVAKHQQLRSCNVFSSETGIDLVIEEPTETVERDIDVPRSS